MREKLDQLRSLQETEAVANRARFRGPQGESRGLFNPQNQMDAFQLRVAFPTLRALEGSLGPLRSGNPGRLALVGGDETAAARTRDQSGPRGRYEAQRARRLKEIEQEKADEAKERERRKTEPIRRRR